MPNGGKEGLGGWGGGGEVRVGSVLVSSGPASFGLQPGRELCWAWSPSGAMSAGPGCSGTAAAPRRPNNEMGGP